MVVADTLLDAFNVLDIDSGEQDFLKNYYVKRIKTPIDEIAQHVCDKKIKPAKVIFSGHRGSGKTTELRKLREKFDSNEFDIVFIKKSNTVTGVFTDTDIIMLIIEHVFKSYSREIDQLDDMLCDNLEKLFSQIVDEDDRNNYHKRQHYNFESWISTIKAKLTGTLKEREKQRSNLNHFKFELLNSLNMLVLSLEKLKKKRIVIIVDGLEKINSGLVIDFLSDYAESLINLEFHLILTIPPSIVHSNRLASIRNSFQINFLPLFEVKTINGADNKQEIDNMINIIKKRVSEKIFPEVVVKKAAILSGGVITDFFRMLQECCTKARLSQADSISLEFLTKSFNRLSNEYKSATRPSEFAILRKVHATKTVSLGDTIFSLLFSQSILQYHHDNENWYDVHPAVAKMLE